MRPLPNAVLTLSFALAAQPLAAQPATGDTPTLRWSAAPRKLEFLRLARDAHGVPLALELAVVRLVPDRGADELAFVDLVGVVHVGDVAYYRRLDRWLATEYAGAGGCVLFEMAHEEDPRALMDRSREEEGGLERMFRSMQSQFTNQLGLANQLDHIDYRRPHFVHADTSLQDAMRRRGDDELTLLGGVLLDLLRGANQPGRGGDPFGGGFDDPDFDERDPFGGFFGMGTTDPTTAKRRTAEQLASQDLSQGIPGLTTVNDLLIDQRNAVCMQRFEERLAAGDRRFAIFFGAAHMRDFAARLVLDHGLRPARVAWLTAWDLREGGPQALPRDATPEDLLEAFEGLDEEQKRALLERLQERARRRR